MQMCPYTTCPIASLWTCLHWQGKASAHIGLDHDPCIVTVPQIFFDNESRNCRDVEKLGVTCVYTPDGMTEAVWKKGLEEFKTAQDK